LNTFTPTISTLRPTTIPPTVLPTNLPITSPTQIPTLSPTAILTSSPTQNSVGSSSLNSGSVSNQQSTPTTTIGAIVGCIVILLILIGICAFILNRKSKTTTLTPFEKWTTHYSTKRPVPQPQLKQNVVDDDIHHFYNKSPRPSFNPNPTFTPHLSTRQSQRYSQTSPQRNSDRMTYRNAETSFNL
jgi:hypothetical protein